MRATTQLFAAPHGTVLLLSCYRVESSTLTQNNARGFDQNALTKAKVGTRQ